MENATGRNLIANFEIVKKINATDCIFSFSQIVYPKSSLPIQKKNLKSVFGFHVNGNLESATGRNDRMSFFFTSYSKLYSIKVIAVGKSKQILKQQYDYCV